MPRVKTSSASTPAALPEGSKNGKTVPSSKWWQWLLMYPTVVVAMIGAVPTYYEWLKPGEDQSEFWKRNAACYKEAPTPQAVITKGNDSIEVTVCPTGDVLIKVTPPNNAELDYHWIGRDILTKKVVGYLVPTMQEAFAEERHLRFDMLAQSGSRVICQRMDSNGFIIRIIEFSNGRCRQEVINPSTGKVVRSGSVDCTEC